MKVADADRPLGFMLPLHAGRDKITTHAANRPHASLALDRETLRMVT